MSLDELLSGNEKFRNTLFKEHRELYTELMKGQKPTVLWIGCSDSRVQTGHITGTNPGTIFNHRNIGNIIPPGDWNISTVLEYGIKHLKIRDIVICGHSDCGAVKALDADLEDSYVPNWLSNAMEAKNRVDKKLESSGGVKDPRERSRMIEHENVRLQVEHLRTYPIIKKGLENKTLDVHGLYYDIESGVLSKVI